MVLFESVEGFSGGKGDVPDLLHPRGVQARTVVSVSQMVPVQSHTPPANGVTLTVYPEAPMTGSHTTTGVSVSTTVVFVSVSTAGSTLLSRMRTFLMLAPVTGGTLSNVFVKDGPTFQTPALFAESIARTRQK